ncbi:putative DNA-binding domain [Popillia japonica]|uniref:DNA-binding domain n=1 Tax=Popillia japonica TaxID=7064 RepID=A0AAW1JZ50_POPJA
MIKGNHRINGFVTTLSGCGKNATLNSYCTTNSLEPHDILSESETSNLNSAFDTESLGLEDNKYFQIKDEPQDDFEHKDSICSIIGLGHESSSNKHLILAKQRFKRSSLRSTHHETLQRIDSSSDLFNHYQRHWFSTGLEKLKLEDRSREERLEITRYELKRHLKQIIKSNVGHATTLPDLYNNEYVNGTSRSLPSGYDRLVAPRMCDIKPCKQLALPCTRYCTRHIMHNEDQVLFNYCTAKFADNTQCSIPVFDITHELPLCTEHARKRDNYKMYQETKPKKLRKKVKPSAMIRPQKRNKKRKKPLPKTLGIETCSIVNNTVILNETADVRDDSSELAEDMVEQVLGLQEPDLELPADDQVLVSQAGHLLEEPDITNVLNTIQPDEFNDFFTVNRNGEYEPSREETEELERALAAVDNDVKSLEKLSQSHGLLDSLLDENTLVESLVQIPDMFHNGYGSCGDIQVDSKSGSVAPLWFQKM